MALQDIFNKEVSAQVISRINKLNDETQPLWGTMDVARMLAHCNVTYEMIYENKHPKPNAFVKFLLKAFVKKTVVGDAPYKRNSRTAPAFLIADSRVFETEKKRLVEHITRTQQLGRAQFEGKKARPPATSH